MLISDDHTHLINYVFFRLFGGLVDCAVYFNCYSGGVASDTPPTGPLLTMLLDKSLVRALDVSDTATPTSGSKPHPQIQPEIVELLDEAKQGGVEIQTIVKFNQRWQEHKKTTS